MATTGQVIGNQLLYPLDDPSQAFTAALQATGVNPYASNPFVTQLQKAAQGARTAFLTSNLNRQMNGPMNAVPDVSSEYGNWLQSQLRGGNLMNTLSATAGNWGNTVNAMKQFEAEQARGDTGAAAISPYAAGLHDLFAANNGQGAMSTYATLRTPQLGALASPWLTGVRNASDAAMNRYYQQGDINASPWDWLFPRDGRGIF